MVDQRPTNSPKNLQTNWVYILILVAVAAVAGWGIWTYAQF
jgi:hypothetical protein